MQEEEHGVVAKRGTIFDQAIDLACLAQPGIGEQSMAGRWKQLGKGTAPIVVIAAAPPPSPQHAASTQHPAPTSEPLRSTAQSHPGP